MNKNKINRLQQSWLQAARKPDRFIERFYGHVFDFGAELRKLFKQYSGNNEICRLSIMPRMEIIGNLSK